MGTATAFVQVEPAVAELADDWQDASVDGGQAKMPALAAQVAASAAR